MPRRRLGKRERLIKANLSSQSNDAKRSPFKSNCDLSNLAMFRATKARKWHYRGATAGRIHRKGLKNVQD